MSRTSEEISRNNTTGGKPDSNIANDALHLGGIEAEDYALKTYVENYHNTHATRMKRELEAEDSENLAVAKAYTDQVVSNQDFSEFAKLTDVQVLNQNLSQTIQNGLDQQKNYTDGQINAVVDDVNENFDDVNTAINNLNQSQQQLFTSVSNGKANVAAAITDQGIETASDATFATMATNIRKIPTGGGEPDPTSAVASDIRLGKSAYVNGQKILGTSIINDLPTYGTDTSNGNIVPEDVAFGKVAFSGGQAIVGTLQNNQINPNVQEINAISLSDYVFNRNSMLTGDPPDGQAKMDYRPLVKLSRDCNFMVSVVTNNKMLYSDNNVFDHCIESHAVNENGAYYSASSGATSEEIVYKKYRYTKEELRIEEYEKVTDIYFGAPGLDDSPNKCLLILKTSMKTDNGTTSRLHFYTYHLTDNGVIGRISNNEQISIDNLIFDARNIDINFMCPSPIKWNEFYCFTSDGDNYNGYDTRIGVKRLIKNVVNEAIQYTFDTIYYLRGTTSQCNPYAWKWSVDYKYLIAIARENNGYSGNIIIQIDGNGVPIALLHRIDDGSGTYYRGTSNLVSGDVLFDSNILLYCFGSNDSSQTYAKLGIYELQPQESGMRKTKEIRLSGRNSIIDMMATQDQKRLICIAMDHSTNYGGFWQDSGTQIEVFDLETILNASDGDTISPLGVYPLGQFAPSRYWRPIPIILQKNINGTNVKAYGSKLELDSYTPKVWIEMQGAIAEENENELMGIMYKGNYFSRTKSHVLTAGQGDVKEGKTFIGWQGYPETGTMEVE